MQLIVRKEYLNELIELYGTPDIKVITGIRRSGKSVLLQEFVSYLQSLEKPVNIVMINLQELEFDHLLEYHALHKYVLEQYKEGMTNVLLIDEVQLCPQFELAINSIYTKGIYDIYITSSNAFLLSSDLATLFTGRTMEIKVYPFSFVEYLTYYGITDRYDEAFDQYVRTGGMPGAYVYKTEDRQYDYVGDVYSTILIRDLVEKYKIRNKSEFTNISEFMMDNIGNLLSPNNISKTLKNDQSEITRKTVSKYIGYLENAFLFYEAKRYDLKGKNIWQIIVNIIFVIHHFVMQSMVHETWTLEEFTKILFIWSCVEEDMRYMWEKLYKKEVDFVAKKREAQIYIQVSDNISDEKTFEREYSPLLAIRDAYPKMIIARTHHETYDYKGVQVVDICRWLRE